LLFGFYGKVEPYQIYNIKSDVTGKVIEVNKSAEGKVAKGIVIKIDDYQNRIDLNNLRTQLKNLKIVQKSQEEIMKIKEKIYSVYKKLKTKSQFDKDNKFFDYQNSKITFFQTNNTISSIKAQIKKLEDTISKKQIAFKNYIYSLNVNMGDFVNFATPIATIMDISKTKIDIFIPIDKIENLKNKRIFINGKLSNFKIEKIYKVSDDKFVTSYKVELVGQYPKISDIVKVSFK